MSNLRRYFRPEDWVFLTHVTYGRQPILTEHAEVLLKCIRDQCDRTGARLYAWSILPDHVHLLLVGGRVNPSLLTRRMKLAFSARYRSSRGMKSGRVWQYRFYDHIIRDDVDLKHHLDYIHYNPVKHRLVDDPFNWEWSSLSEFLEQGCYDPAWRPREDFDGEFGE